MSRSGSVKDRNSYVSLTHRPLNALVFLLPGLVFFQIGTACYGTSLLAPRDLGRLLGFFGATAGYLPAMLIVAVLLIQHLFHKDRWSVQPTVLAGMACESLAWTIPLLALSRLTGLLLSQSAAESAASNLLPQVLLAVGAGIYEEFMFRLMMISLGLLIFVDVFELPKSWVTGIAVLVSSCLFSLYHLGGNDLNGGGGFPLVDFVFRAAAGAYLAGIYIIRGFAITVGSHILFNLYVVAVAAG